MNVVWFLFGKTVGNATLLYVSDIKTPLLYHYQVALNIITCMTKQKPNAYFLTRHLNIIEMMIFIGSTSPSYTYSTSIVNL